MKKFLVIFLSFLTLYVFANVYYGNLHAHTSYSDGKLFPEDAYSYAKNYVDIQAITDHAYYFTQLINGKTKPFLTKEAAKKATVEGEFIALQGFEWTSGIGHINVYESLEWVDRNNVPSAEGFYKWLIEHKKLGQFNHPISIFGNFNDFEYYPEADKYMNLIEVGNGNWKQGDVINSEMLQNYKLSLDKGWHLGATVGQDNHKVNWGSANEGRTGIVADALTYNDIMKALWARHVFGTEDKDVIVFFGCGENIMGDIVYDKENVILHFEYEDDDTLTYFALVSQSGTVVEAYPNQTKYSTDISVKIPDGYEWYYVYALQSDKDEVVTSPIYFQRMSNVYVNNHNYFDGKLSFDIYNITSSNESVLLEIKSNGNLLYTENISLKAFEKKYKVLELKLPAGENKVEFFVNGIFVQSLKTFVKKFEKSVMIDTLHENDHLDFLKKLAVLLDNKGYRVLFSKRMLNDLKDVDVLIISTPKIDGFDFSKDLLNPEIEALKSFKGKIILVPGSDKTYFELYKKLINADVMSLEELEKYFGLSQNVEPNVFIDIGHGNDYGRGKLTKFENFLRAKGFKVEYLDKISKVSGKLLVIQNGRDYTKEELENIKSFVENGGRLLIASKSDYKDGGNTESLNDILEYLGSNIRFNDDQVLDDVNNYGVKYKILANGLRFYSPCSLIISDKNMIVVFSDSAYTEDADNNGDAMIVDKVVLVAREEIGSGEIFVFGKFIFSDYDFDYNKDFMENILN
ncbi:phosphotransferase [Thermosipho melanesiensis]|uniref:PHP C-terminal domain protein n=2 Tax=Thermosipho melanesiensis TaxID=46541 RepID=A6LJ04_THEM4|nr:DUF4350 domain-containing protein [Thermosipho melanesiensis]ABR29905.1 PHP C-terminal domain protein [Thermosipho melanesiensis BI429]APT73113.1 phosphotransferase [Thermosipho melanesiensis]OOC38512.1 phosphotransferase [Thermosipho melanesiensis]OOC40316.1 phosphotransferase [Thermosipho melanesiensis]OOC40580.1 phosphotransferase [Thermosipho melanesiensis]